MSSQRPALSLSWLVDRYKNVVVISPHMDDAILSCGGLLSQLLKHLPCVTLTVCTGDPEHADPQNPPHGIALPSLRRAEEVAALAALGCPLLQLDLLDAIYRRDETNGVLLYPSMNSVWSMPSASDTVQKEKLSRKLSDVLSQLKDQPTLILSPLGVGHHVDHILCTQVVLSVLGRTDDVLLYEDFPYVVDQGAHVGIADTPERALQRFGLVGQERFEQLCNTDEKMAWIAHYESQIDSIFGSHANVRPLLMKNSRDGCTLERFWKVSKN